MKVVTNRQHRAALFQFRCGVLPLKVETWRFQDIPVEYRLCVKEILLKQNTTFCSKYNQLKYFFFTNLNGLFTLDSNFDYSDDDFKLTVLMSNEYIKSIAKLIWECFNIRRRNMYFMV